MGVCFFAENLVLRRAANEYLQIVEPVREGDKVRQKEVTHEVLARAGRYRKVSDSLEVKEVGVDERRYVVCRNPIEALKDKATREALMERLQKTISEKGPKSFVSNRGYARFLKVRKDGVSINHEAVEGDARFDGKFVLTTHTELSAELHF